MASTLETFSKEVTVATVTSQRVCMSRQEQELIRINSCCY